MEEEKGGGESSRASSKFVKAGDRQMFTVELRPGETTIVSWKKLLKDTNKVNGPSTSSAPEPPPANAHPALESRIAPVQQLSGDEVKDEAAPHRFSAVIEKIERLYMGKDSSDDEDLNDIPDDDQYDTEDSFIDDAELDEYFEVDNSAIKHDGFFVNRGKLERISVPAALPNQQPKKRRRKEAKGPGGNDDSHVPNKHAKVGKTAAAKITSTLAKNSSAPIQTVTVPTEHCEDVKFHNQLNVCGLSSTKKSTDSKTILDPSLLKVSEVDAAALQAEVKDMDKQKTGVLLSKDPSNRFKDAGGSSDGSYQKYHEKSAYVQTKPQSGRPSSNADEMETVRAREKNGVCEIPDLNLTDGKYAVPTTKPSHGHKRDSSSVRSKSSMLEKAITDLEKMVAESRPPAADNQDADNLSQAIKRRLPREIKAKLAKVARLAQASHGKITKELLNRLMNILGHLIQLRTLKRNLKVMISMGLSAKKEKDDRFQQIKREVIDMIKIKAPSSESKALQQQSGASDDFQEISSGAKELSKRKFSMDAALEDKICDLYDLFVDGLDEDAGPQIRKLYAELAGLWPNGFMDNHGIKRAICRSKERRRERYGRNKDQEKMRRKKMLAPRTEETVRVEASSIAQQQYMRERLATEPSSHSLTNKAVSGTAAAVRTPSPINGPSFDRLKQEKLKGSSSNSPDDARVGDGALTKKKVKRKPEQELDETRIRPEKLPSQQGEERHKSLKQAAGLPHKSNLQSTVLPSVEQSS
ncbi:hypothetical protein ACE6H2_004891 [Prunus campanulata]